jgi:hypothetical protein
MKRTNSSRKLNLVNEITFTECCILQFNSNKNTEHISCYYQPSWRSIYEHRIHKVITVSTCRVLYQPLDNVKKSHRAFWICYQGLHKVNNSTSVFPKHEDWLLQTSDTVHRNQSIRPKYLKYSIKWSQNISGKEILFFYFQLILVQQGCILPAFFETQSSQQPLTMILPQSDEIS